MDRTDNYRFLTSGPIGKVILTMAVPTVISMLVSSIYNIVDSYYVGMLNTQATAAVGLVFPVMSLIQAVGFFFGQGSGTYISRELGAKHQENAEVMASTSFFSSVIFSCFIGIFGLIFLDPLSRFIGSTPTILPYTKTLLLVMLLATPLYAGSFVLNNQMRFQGNASRAMYGLLVGAVVNVILVPILMFAVGMGFLGMAIGTAVSEAVAFVLLLWMSSRAGNISIDIRKFRPSKEIFSNIVGGGTPSLVRQGFASVAVVLLNVVTREYGDAAIAGLSLVGRISFMIFAVMLGIGQGYQPFCGFNYGARLYDRIRKGFSFAMKASLLVLAVAGTLCFIFAPQILWIMRPDPDVVKVGTLAFRCNILALPFVAFVTISNMTLQTCGRTIPANIVASCRNGIVFIPAILILSPLLGLLGLQLCQAVTDFVSFLVALPLIARFFRSLKN